MSQIGEYDILELHPVDATQFQRLDAEQLGSKRKFWFSFGDTPQPWLFKYARANTGEHWAEKITAELAPLIDLSAAEVELATFQDEAGTASPSFIPYASSPSTRPSASQTHC